MKYSSNRIDSRAVLACLGIFGAIFSSACSPSAKAEPAGTAAAQSDATSSSPAATAAGESCKSSDPDQLCLAINFVSYQDSKGNPVASPEQAATILKTMNQLWKKCKIGFQVENYEKVDPSKYDLAFGEDSQSQTDQIRSTFSSRKDSLLAVTTGPWNTSVNAWTNMPGEKVYGAIMESGIVDYGDGIIYAHEFGHYLGLDHASDSSNLMNPVIYTDSTELDSDQCQTARDIIHSYWSAMIR